MWSGERLTKRQVTSRPDLLWPELWIKVGRNAKLKERHKWSDEQPKLDNARRLRRVYFIDPEDTEFKETTGNARINWIHQLLQPCLARQARRVSMGRPVVRPTISNQHLRVSWKPVNPQGCVWKKLYRNITRTISQEREDNSLQHYNLVHKLSYASSHENSACENSSG